MEKSKRLLLEKLILLINSSERKYKAKDYIGAIEDKRMVNSLLKSKLCNVEIKNKIKGELSRIYQSRFDLIFDHKKIISNSKRKEIINYLKEKSEERYKFGDYKGSIKAIRRSEKYQY